MSKAETGFWLGTAMAVGLVIGNLAAGWVADKWGKDNPRFNGWFAGLGLFAAFPLALTAEDLDAELIARERKIAAEKAAESGKPAEVQAKMVDGAIAKFAKENALLSQLFVMDNKTPVAQVVEAAGKAAGTKIVLKDYVRFQLGEGIEKVESDFAAEVAAAAGLN